MQVRADGLHLTPDGWKWIAPRQFTQLQNAAMRTKIVLCVGILALVVSLASSPESQVEHKVGPTESTAAPRTRPNVVFIMVDDMRNDDLRYMPQTRRLIRDQGVRFRNSFSPYPLCCPARASVLSGLYTHNHRGLHGL